VELVECGREVDESDVSAHVGEEGAERIFSQEHNFQTFVEHFFESSKFDLLGLHFI